MKKYINILLAFSLLASFAACDEDTMDDINENVNDPTEVGSHLIITDVMTSTAFRVVGSDPAFYASVYVEHNVGIYNQSYNAEIRSGEPISSTTYNNSWGSIYENLYNLKLIVEKCSEGGNEEGNFHTLGIAQVLTAYNLAVLTDLWGDVPWTEALLPGQNFTPALDSQEDLYNVIFTLLDDGIANLNKETDFPSLGGQDFLYGGDADLWIKFANGLKARYTMRLSHRNPSYSDVITFADASFEDPGEQCQFEYADASPFYQFLQDRNYFGASQSLHDKLVVRNDPRDDVFFDGDVFAPNGEPEQVQDYYSKSAISVPTAPTYLLSYHELQFLKAEAYVRMGGQEQEAKDALLEGIKAAFQKVNIGLTEEDAEEYFSDEVEPRFDNNALAEVMNQKYIAFYEEEAVEAYNDYRRLKAMGDDVITLQNPANAEQFPLRFSYGADDVTTNENVRQAYGDGSYVYSENVWWAGGSR
ncbi:MAG: SusD-like 3 [Anaerophaga sp.]|nr:SusD-like 3 [Anaerophaga sp.]MDK2842811.1 hypothetical protein [Anaerophaga sp.]